MFDDEDEKKEKYVGDDEHGDHNYEHDGPLQDEVFEKCFPEWVIIAVTVINALFLLFGAFNQLDFYLWVIVYALNFLGVIIDSRLTKENYFVDDKDVVSHYQKERAKIRKKMWYAFANVLMALIVPTACIDVNRELTDFCPVAFYFFIGGLSYLLKANSYKDKIELISDSLNMLPLKVYVASSWRNEYYPEVVSTLRDAGFDVYDFRNPPTGDGGFKWSYIDENYMDWTPEQYREQLNNNPLAVKQLKNDIDAMKACDACVLVLPCGRSAHTEAGWFCGAGKKVVVYIPCKQEPELMYALFDGVATTMEEIIEMVRG